MADYKIHSISTYDARFALPLGAGTDSIHETSEYCLATTLLSTQTGVQGSGFVLTLGDGNTLVCKAIEMLAKPLEGMAIEAVMADFGNISRKIADHAALRWLGPHKGVVQLALASITNACFDLWAKSRGVPLWKLLLDLTPEELVRVLDLSYLEEILSQEKARSMLREQLSSRCQREGILKSGYPGYDTSVGWMDYDDDKVTELTKKALDQGFSAFKLKVGSREESRDLRRAAMLRKLIGEDSTLMFDANQRWDLPDALRICGELAKFRPHWIEEPTHPDDIQAHVKTIPCGEPGQDRRRRAHRQPCSVQELPGSPSVVVCAGRLHQGCGGQRIPYGQFAGQDLRSYPWCRTWATWGNCISTWFSSTISG
jgi:L-fuconate dehydratase